MKKTQGYRPKTALAACTKMGLQAEGFQVLQIHQITDPLSARLLKLCPCSHCLPWCAGRTCFFFEIARLELHNTWQKPFDSFRGIVCLS